MVNELKLHAATRSPQAGNAFNRRNMQTFQDRQRDGGGPSVAPSQRDDTFKVRRQEAHAVSFD